MTLNTFVGMELHLEVRRFVRMAVFTLRPSYLGRIVLTKLNDPFMRVVTYDAVDGDVFALEQFFVLFMMLYETTTCIYSFDRASEVAVTTSSCISINIHGK